MTNAEHPAWTPQWQRQPCLGCDAVVKRSRAAWVEVVGTPSGTWLVAAPTSAGRAVGTNVKDLPAEGLFVLGVAHGACLDAAFHRIQTGAVSFGSVLVPATVDSPDDVPSLHLPSERGDCLFCDRADGGPLTDEHVWPKWMLRELVARGGRFSARGPARETSPLGPTVPVCEECNNRWMSVLENDAKPLLLGMWDGPRALQPREQEVLATWATKTAVVLDGLEQASIPRGFAHDVRVSRRPPGGVWVWAAPFVGPARWLAAWLKPLRLAPRGGVEPDQPNGVCVTFTAGKIVFQVMFTFELGIFDLNVRADQAAHLTALWPLGGGVRPWPVGGFDAEAVEDFAERLCTHRTGDQQL